MMNIKPLRGNLVVKLFIHNHSRNGLYIPDIGIKESNIGEVIAVGTGKVLPNGLIEPIHVKIGDKVVINKHSGTKMIIEEDEYLVINEDDILAIIEEI